MSREKGDQLELYVLDTWPDKTYLEPNSGAANNQNDLFTSEYSIECKRKLSQSSVSVTGGEIRKARIKANRQHKDPLWIIESTEGIYVLCPYNEFCELLSEAHGKEE